MEPVHDCSYHQFMHYLIINKIVNNSLNVHFFCSLYELQARLPPFGMLEKNVQKYVRINKNACSRWNLMKIQSHPSIVIISSAVFSSVENKPYIRSVTGRLISIITDSPSCRGSSCDGFNILFSYRASERIGILITAIIVMSALL